MILDYNKPTTITILRNKPHLKQKKNIKTDTNNDGWKQSTHEKQKEKGQRRIWTLTQLAINRIEYRARRWLESEEQESCHHRWKGDKLWEIRRQPLPATITLSVAHARHCPVVVVAVSEMRTAFPVFIRRGANWMSALTWEQGIRWNVRKLSKPGRTADCRIALLPSAQRKQ